MRAYTCCPDAGCTTYRDTLSFLKHWSIEPAIGVDDHGHYFEFDVPPYWPKRKLRAFAKAFGDKVAPIPPEENEVVEPEEGEEPAKDA